MHIKKNLGLAFFISKILPCNDGIQRQPQPVREEKELHERSRICAAKAESPQGTPALKTCSSR